MELDSDIKTFDGFSNHGFLFLQIRNSDALKDFSLMKVNTASARARGSTTQLLRYKFVKNCFEQHISLI